MSSRVAVQQFVSTYEPSSVQIGDEWYNPSTDRLYKRTITSSGVGWIELLFGTGTAVASIISGVRAATVTTATLTAKALINIPLGLPTGRSYTLSDAKQYLDVYVDGYRLVKDIDYRETSSTAITPLISLPIGTTLEYRIL